MAEAEEEQHQAVGQAWGVAVAAVVEEGLPQLTPERASPEVEAGAGEEEGRHPEVARAEVEAEGAAAAELRHP